MFGWMKRGREKAGVENKNVNADVDASWDSLGETTFAGNGMDEAGEGGLDGVAEMEVTPEDAALLRKLGELSLNNSLVPSGEEFAKVEQDENGELGWQTLEAFKNFFTMDMRTKEAIAKAAPDMADLYDDDSRMRYLDGLSKEFSGFQYDFQKVAQEFRMGDAVLEATAKFFRRGGESFATGKTDVDAVRRVYDKRFLQMRDDLIENMQKRYGYRVFWKPERIIDQTESVNELLHVFHRSIMGNEDILQRVPARETRGMVSLRGEDGRLAKEVYDTIPEDLDIGETDIISVDDKMLMMVRDRAHALMIEAEPMKEHPGNVIVHYNLPKIINREMVEQLPGIGEISERNASGRFEVPEQGFGSQMAEFISWIPTDADNPDNDRIISNMI